MHSEDEPQLTLSKWPFYLGDILLVATALAIAVLGKWQLTDIQVTSCVIAVALGAGLFVLPYIVEYYMRSNELSDDRDDQLRVLQRHIQQIEAALIDCDTRITDLGNREASTSQAEELLASAMDQKLAQADQVHAELKTAIGALELKLEQLASAEPKKDDSAQQAIEALQGAIAEFEVKLTEAGQPNAVIEALEQRIHKLETVEPAPLAEPQAPRQRRKTESRLLKRAIKEKQDRSSKAVSRIIESKSLTETPEVQKPDADDAADSAVLELEAAKATADAVAAKAPAAEVAEPEPVSQPEPEVEPAIEEVPKVKPVKRKASKAKPVVEPEALAQAEVSPEVESQPEPVTSVVDTTEELDLEAEIPPMSSSDMLFDAEPVPTTSKRARAKKKDSVLTVSVLIGIGNKPFLRGSGGGLSWEQGIVMDFQEIGKWRWLAPSDLEAPIEVQIFRNDEDPDLKGKHILEPGQKLEISPKF